MSALRGAITSYLALRRSLGHKLDYYENYLADFVQFTEGMGDTFITAKAILKWAYREDGTAAKTRAWRLRVVCGFAQYMSAFEPRTENPPKALVRLPTRRFMPFIYSDENVISLMRSAMTMKGRRRLTPSTYSTMIGLLAATGMRLGEALALNRDDVRYQEGLLLIRKSKFGKSRNIPVQQTTMAALEAYAEKRDSSVPRPRSPSFFISRSGTRLFAQNVDEVFARLLRRVGLPYQPGHRPRIHDLRHTFAVRTLKGWIEAGVDVQARLPHLSTYLGHVAPAATYWYLTAIPELMVAAASRFEKHIGGLQ
jgi:integrase/recombinase XerD